MSKVNHTEQIIQDAIDGGWSKITYGIEGGHTIFIEQVALLDPSFWQAVGKTRKWEKVIPKELSLESKAWSWYWHRFIDHLAEGDDYETALSKLV